MSIAKVANLLQKMLDEGASDLYLTYGFPPSLRIEGRLKDIAETPLADEDISGVIAELLSEDQRHEFESTLELNIAVNSFHNERFRVNFFRQQQHNGLVIRRIQTKIPSIASMNLPKIYADLAMEKRGLVLMVGATGSGKSTSLAAMLDHRNSNGTGHIVTIEDPIEFVHLHKSCIFTQREIGIDTYSYGVALKNALRQSPDVVVIGEIRDRETMESALQFAEAGHLCLATLHSINSSQAIERVTKLFPDEFQRQVLLSLSQNLKAIISQRLVHDISGKYVLAHEILLNQGLIKRLIEENKTKEIKELMEKNRDIGMITFDQALVELYVSGRISEETVVMESDNPNNVKIRIAQEKGRNDGLKKVGYVAQTLDSIPPVKKSYADDF